MHTLKIILVLVAMVVPESAMAFYTAELREVHINIIPIGELVSAVVLAVAIYWPMRKIIKFGNKS